MMYLKEKGNNTIIIKYLYAIKAKEEHIHHMHNWIDSFLRP